MKLSGTGLLDTSGARVLRESSLLANLAVRIFGESPPCHFYGDVRPVSILTTAHLEFVYIFFTRGHYRMVTLPRCIEYEFCARVHCYVEHHVPSNLYSR